MAADRKSSQRNLSPVRNCKQMAMDITE